MKPMAILGVLLIAIGIAGLAIDNISFTERKTIVDARSKPPVPPLPEIVATEVDDAIEDPDKIIDPVRAPAAKPSVDPLLN